MRKWYHTTSSYCWPPNQGFSSPLPQTQRTWGITKPFSYRYWLFCMIWLLRSNEEVISYNFLILLTSKPRFFKSTTSNTENLRNYKTFLLQILIILYDMTIAKQWGSDIIQLPHTANLQTKVFQVHYLKHRELEELQNLSLTDIDYFVWYDYCAAMRKWYHTTSSYWWPPNQGFSSSLPQTQRTWGITKPFSYRYWLFFMIWLLWALMKRYHATSS